MILGIVVLGLFVIGKWDRPLSVSRKGRLWILMGAAAESVCIAELTGCNSVCERLLWAVIGGCLLLACITDSLLCQVYNFTWWISLAAALLLWCCRGEPGESVFLYSETLGWLMLFVGIQLAMGGRIYGRADSYAFCVCALAEASQGISAAGFLVHMLSAYILLFIVQAFRRNINKKGNLRKPVPFLPYITAAFWMTVVLDCLVIG